MSTARPGRSVAGPGRPIVARRLLFTRLRSGIQNEGFVGVGKHGAPAAWNRDVSYTFLSKSIDYLRMYLYDRYYGYFVGYKWNRRKNEKNERKILNFNNAKITCPNQALDSSECSYWIRLLESIIGGYLLSKVFTVAANFRVQNHNKFGKTHILFWVLMEHFKTFGA